MIRLSLTITQPLLPRSQVARLETASHRSKKYLSQLGLPLPLKVPFTHIALDVKMPQITGWCELEVFDQFHNPALASDAHLFAPLASAIRNAATIFIL
jgi:hypothetical protein